MTRHLTTQDPAHELRQYAGEAVPPVSPVIHSEPDLGHVGEKPALASEPKTGRASSDAFPVRGVNENFARVHVMGTIE